MYYAPSPRVIREAQSRYLYPLCEVLLGFGDVWACCVVAKCALVLADLALSYDKKDGWFTLLARQVLVRFG